MLRNELWRVALVAVVLATGCGAGQAALGQSTGTSPKRREPPPIRWERPMADGVTTTLERARSDGRLPFEPPRPGPGMQPALVQVSAPDTPVEARRMYMTFRMPRSADFPEDGRITVSVKQTLATVDTLREMDLRNEPAEAYRMITIAGRPALLIEFGGIGRVQYVEDGLLYDIYGPALPADRAAFYAEKAFFGR